MNCLQFRREKLADPRRISAEAAQHVAGCPQCQVFARRVEEGEERLVEALQVAVPEGLADRVLLAVRGGRRLRLKLMALAATVVLAAGIGLVWWKDAASPEHAMMAIEHVMHEPESFVTTKNANPDFFRQIMHEFGGELDAPLGRIRYIKLCPINGGAGWHIVFETEHGLATLLLVPGDRMGRRTEQASIGGWTALARGGGKGFYALITNSAETLAALDQMVKQHVRWKT